METTVKRRLTIWGIVQQTVKEFMEDEIPLLGAALAYYTVFSLAPLLIIILAVSGLWFGKEAVAGEIHDRLDFLLGAEGANGVQSMVAGVSNKREGYIATILGVAALVFGATGVFTQLKSSLNKIWEVEGKPGQAVWNLVFDRIRSFFMVLGIACLLLLSLVTEAVLAASQRMVADLLPTHGHNFLMQLINIGLSVIAITFLFAMMFKYLPDVTTSWSDVWIGAFVTALLFTFGKYVIGLYLRHAALTTTYGVAGSVIVVLLWSYYTSQIIFFGAEFTQVYARARGAPIAPRPNARWKVLARHRPPDNIEEELPQGNMGTA